MKRPKIEEILTDVRNSGCAFVPMATQKDRDLSYKAPTQRCRDLMTIEMLCKYILYLEAEGRKIVEPLIASGDATWPPRDDEQPYT